MCEKIGEKRSRNPAYSGTKARPLDVCARIAIVLIPGAHSFLVMARRDGTKGQQTGQPRPFRCPSTMTCALHHSSFTHASNIPPFLLHARCRSNRWTVLLLRQMDRNLALRDESYIIRWSWKYLFLFLRNRYLYLLHLGGSFFVLFVREEDFSLSVDNRNIFQGERGGGENLLGWRIVLFFFFFRSLRGRSDRVLIDRERFDTLRRVDQKVALLEIQEINERVREISKDKCIYKLVTKIFIAEHNYRWNYSFT